MIKIRVGKKKKACGKPLYEEESLLEATDEELEHITDMLGDIDGEDLAFNDIFNGKMRLILPFPVYDENSELGKFLALFSKVGWTPDFEKGTMSKGKMMVKIGRWFSKLEHLLDSWLNVQKEIEQIINRTGSDIEDEDLQYKKKTRLFEKLRKAIRNYLPYSDPEWNDPEWSHEMGAYWAKNAAYIKANADPDLNSSYSLVMTRSPIDVFRMSDFDNLLSCHSPPSTGNHRPEYKCAVAEAHGHGAVGYVVKSEDLRDIYESDSLEEIENRDEFQRDEVFADDVRGFHSPTAPGSIEPITRLRLRQFRAYPDGLDGESFEIGVPEKVLYGTKYPDAYQILLRWAQNVQQEQIRKMPTTEGGVVDFDKVVKFGGSWIQDPSNELLSNLLGVDDWTGDVTQNTETEDDIDANILGGPQLERMEAEIMEAAAEWNRRYRHTHIGANVDIEEGGVYANLVAQIVFKWPLSEVPKPVTPAQASLVVDHVRDNHGMPFFSAEPEYPSIRTSADEFSMRVDIDPAWLTLFGWEQGHVAEPELLEGFDQFGAAVDELDDAYDEFHDLFTQAMRIEGHMTGAMFEELGHEIQNRNLDPYEWDMTATEDQYSHSGAYENVSATNNTTVSINRIHQDTHNVLNLEAIMKELKSHDFAMAWRQKLLWPAKSEVGTSYNVDVNVNVSLEAAWSEDAYIEIYTDFTLTQDANDEQVKVLRHVIEYWDDEEEIMDAAANMMSHYLYQVARKNNLLRENKKPDVEYFVKMWKGKL
tara:strand:- start:3814 stop:6090 length:2277 start_codon:yes stop_codon:yes gene_type:complete